MGRRAQFRVCVRTYSTRCAFHHTHTAGHAGLTAGNAGLSPPLDPEYRGPQVPDVPLA